MLDGNHKRGESEGPNILRPGRRKDGSFDIESVAVRLHVEDEFGPLFKSPKKKDNVDPEFAQLMQSVIASLKACRVANDLHDDPLVLAVQHMARAFEELQRQPFSQIPSKENDAKLFSAVQGIVRANWPVGWPFFADLDLVNKVVRAIRNGEDVLAVLDDWENSFA